MDDIPKINIRKIHYDKDGNRMWSEFDEIIESYHSNYSIVINLRANYFSDMIAFERNMVKKYKRWFKDNYNIDAKIESNQSLSTIDIYINFIEDEDAIVAFKLEFG